MAIIVEAFSDPDVLTFGRPLVRRASVKHRTPPHHLPHIADAGDGAQLADQGGADAVRGGQGDLHLAGGVEPGDQLDLPASGSGVGERRADCGSGAAESKKMSMPSARRSIASSSASIRCATQRTESPSACAWTCSSSEHPGSSLSRGPRPAARKTPSPRRRRTCRRAGRTRTCCPCPRSAPFAR